MTVLYLAAAIAVTASLVALIGRRPVVTIPGSTVAAAGWVATAGMFFAFGYAALTVLALAFMAGFVVLVMVEADTVKARERERGRPAPPVQRREMAGSAR